MRLFTHNFLQCHVKGCTQNNFPLRITDAEVQRKEADFNPAFLIGFLDKLEWGALRTAVQDVPCIFGGAQSVACVVGAA